MHSLILASLLITGVSLATPLLLAALGELMAERAGVINVGIEGMMLAGALAGFAVSFHTHSPWLGACGAMAAGIVMAALFALFAIVIKADQIVVGTAINILSLGLTGVFYRALFSESGTSAAAFNPISIPILSQIPVIGQAIFHQNALGYLAWALTPACSWYLYKTLPGLRLRAVGEYPAAADASCVRVQAMRALAILFGGAMAGLGGAYLSIGYANGFVENMSAGRGFIALAVVILGRWKPGGILLAALLFGLASALQYQFQATQVRVPYQFFLALPYLLTLAALLFRTHGKSAAPAALGAAYQRS